MRFAKYIALLVAFFAVSACTIADIDENVTVTKPQGKTDNIQIVGRISRYSEYDVATRGAKTTEEGKVTSMALAIFKIDNDAIGTCEYFEYSDGSELLFTVDRKDKYTADAHYAMYVFANVATMRNFEDDIKVETSENADGEQEIVYDYSAITLADLKKEAYKVKGVNIPETGFPMIGSLGDYVSDDGDRTMQGAEQTFILKPQGEPTPLPTVNGQARDLLTIPMKAMFAKMNFSIIVTPDQTIEDKLPPQFQITGYEVYNVPKEVDFLATTNPNSAEVWGDPCEGDLIGVNDVAVGAGTIDFSFYVPERYLTPAIKSEEYEYPFKKNGTIRDEDKKYMQRYKPELVKGQNATYVRISGAYLDHQNKQFQVSYDIYLGKDNYSNFDIERNSEYNNYITIRGISTSADQTDNDQTISIDHRVNITRLKPITINLRRETLLDSHFEVRPLRIRKTKGYNADVEGAIPVPGSVTVTVSYPQSYQGNNWVGVELANSAISGDHLSSGKRKYFTTDLIANVKQTIEVPITDAQQTVWIYVDECIEVGDEVRSAIVSITYSDGSGNTVKEDFILSQRKLFEVFYDENNNKVKDANERTYHIEYYEEYLHNYDAEDEYGQTEYEGMKWGLEGVQLSHIHDSFICEEDNSDWLSYIQNNPIKYDFYIGKHDDDNESSDTHTKDGGTLHNFAGQEFTREIAENSNSGIKYHTMEEPAQSAVEYCYNRNKRNDNGTVDVQWFLPSADELEEIIIAGYSRFEEFQDKYYWTSQPAYKRNAFYYEYHTGSRNSSAQDTYVFTVYEDNTEYARATKVVYANGEYDYAKSGLNRTPKEPHELDNTCKNQNEIVYNDTYFNVMYAWYRWVEGVLWWTETKTEEKTWLEDTHFGERRDGSSTNKRYHIHLGHSVDEFFQEDENGEHGYLHRSTKARVRCVRKVN